MLGAWEPECQVDAGMLQKISRGAGRVSRGSGKWIKEVVMPEDQRKEQYGSLGPGFSSLRKGSTDL